MIKCHKYISCLKHQCLFIHAFKDECKLCNVNTTRVYIGFICANKHVALDHVPLK